MAWVDESDGPPFLTRFPCARLASPFVSIGSVPTPRTSGTAVDLDAAFNRALRRGADLPIADDAATEACRPNLNAMRTWLSRVVAPAGNTAELGAVPVHVHGLRTARRCIRLAGATSAARRVAYIEFVVHRFGDEVAHHYACQVSARPPYVLYAFRRVGSVSPDALWSIERE